MYVKHLVIVDKREVIIILPVVGGWGSMEGVE